MELRIQLVAIVASAGLLLLVLELVRRRSFLERYALMWIFAALILLGLAIWKGVLQTVADSVGIAYPPNALFLVAFGFVLILLLHFSLAVSRLSDQSKVLAQRLALLEERLRELGQREEGGEAKPVAISAERGAAPEPPAERPPAVLGPRGAVGGRRPPTR
jgi:hypothetical protein